MTAEEFSSEARSGVLSGWPLLWSVAAVGCVVVWVCSLVAALIGPPVAQFWWAPWVLASIAALVWWTLQRSKVRSHAEAARMGLVFATPGRAGALEAPAWTCLDSRFLASAFFSFPGISEHEAAWVKVLAQAYTGSVAGLVSSLKRHLPSEVPELVPPPRSALARIFEFLACTTPVAPVVVLPPPGQLPAWTVSEGHYPHVEEYVRSLGFTPEQAECFETLADEFDGTVDELVSTARLLV